MFKMNLVFTYSKLYKESVFALFLCCISGSVIIGLIESFTESDFTLVFVFIPSVTLYSFIIGIFALAIYGVPLYILLLKTNNENYFTMSFLGVLPGILVFLINNELGLLVMFFGASTATVIHWMCLRSGILNTLTKASN